MKKARRRFRQDFVQEIKWNERMKKKTRKEAKNKKGKDKTGLEEKRQRNKEKRL